jgi:hypothetical protein
LLSTAIAMLASRHNSARIVKESPRFIGRVLSMRLDRPFNADGTRWGGLQRKGPGGTQGTSGAARRSRT